MKYLHLADLHFGKRLKEVNLLPDQEAIVEQIFRLVEEERPDGVILAGDIYDKSVPSAEAVLLFDRFLLGLQERGQEIFIVSGNHDSAERLSFASSLLSKSGVHLSRSYSGKVEKVRFCKGDEEQNIYLLPFIRPIQVKLAYPEEEILSYSDAVRVALSGEEVDEKQVNILVTHQFVTGAQESGSEEMTVGGIHNVDVNLFSAFDYVALGHIHKRQSLQNGRAHYPGTPLKYSLSEAAEARTATLVTVTKEGIESKFLPLKPLRDLREIKGSYDELMRSESEDYVFIRLTDEEEIPDVVRELRKKYPNLMQVKYDRDRSENWEISEAEETDSPAELFSKLFQKQNGVEMTEEQQKTITEMIEKIWEEEV